jgi:large subunit ribosomal protein L28
MKMDFITNKEGCMSAECQVTGSKPGYGKRVSHSHRRSARRWEPNLQRRRYWLPSERRWIRLRVSTKGIKTIDRRGIEAVVAEMRARGVRI